MKFSTIPGHASSSAARCGCSAASSAARGLGATAACSAGSASSDVLTPFGAWPARDSCAEGHAAPANDLTDLGGDGAALRARRAPCVAMRAWNAEEKATRCLRVEHEHAQGAVDAVEAHLRSVVEVRLVALEPAEADAPLRVLARCGKQRHRGRADPDAHAGAFGHLVRV